MLKALYYKMVPRKVSRPVAEVLRLVARSTHYEDNNFVPQLAVFYGNGAQSSTLMCEALNMAVTSGLISIKERNRAVSEVCEYIQPHRTMSSKLRHNGLSYSHPYRKAVYLDWDNRQILEK